MNLKEKLKLNQSKESIDKKFDKIEEEVKKPIKE